MDAAADNRRAVLRTGTFEILAALRSFARLHGGDVFALLVFTTIWSANGENLLGDARYAGLHNIGPDKGSLPITERVANEVLSLPLFYGMTQAEMDTVIDAINAFVPKALEQ